MLRAKSKETNQRKEKHADAWTEPSSMVCRFCPRELALLRHTSDTTIVCTCRMIIYPLPLRPLRSNPLMLDFTQWVHCLSDFTNIKNIWERNELRMQLQLRDRKIVSLNDRCEILTDTWLWRNRSGVSFCPLFFAVKESGHPYLSNVTLIVFYILIIFIMYTNKQ